MLKKVAHFIIVKSNYSANDVVEVFIRETVRLHGVLMKIMLYMDDKFTSVFCKELITRLGINLQYNLSSIERWKNREGK